MIIPIHSKVIFTFTYISAYIYIANARVLNPHHLYLALIIKIIDEQFEIGRGAFMHIRPYPTADCSQLRVCRQHL